ncbi:interferon-inducible GTPase 5-like [Trematomus bernacchii]|uniref:interferon-inducible GTPase 5-like n=1 Tax=Trematomus bernacchii TaxID=40690 RepID=UPI00146CC983|nr:interferon-inducible GTPase 5-like [Trematomus bernacchii]
MEDPLGKEYIDTFKELLQTNVPAATAKIKAYLEEQDNIPLNIAITGECGSGKSTFVNAFRGLDKKDKSDAAAPTGVVETTMEVNPYPHPNFPNVTLWDLPGIGTTNVPAAEYLEHVGFERFDFFIIISADRFRENDGKLALEIQKMKKKFYFVRSKIDHNMRDEEETQSEFNAEKTLSIIRENCVDGLLKHKIESPQVFLVSSFHLHLYDFHLLTNTLEKELPEHKRDTLLLAMPNVHCEIICKKKEALKAKIKYLASLSALTAAVPAPGLSVAVDIAILVKATNKYKHTFGLDSKSMENLALKSGVPLTDLRAVTTSNLSAGVINKKVIMKLLVVSGFQVASLAAEEVSRFIPLLGIPVAAALSFTCTYKALEDCLNMLAEDAERVFKKALGSNSSG